MNKKKILVVAMSLAMVAILAIGGTIAYFTDADYNVNVMTTANVSIDQIEQQRVDGTKGGDNRHNDNILTNYVDGAKLFPVTNSSYGESLIVSNNLPNTNGAGNDIGGFSVPLFNTANNFVDKIVTVKNTSETTEAYVRTVFAFQMGKMVTEEVVDGETVETEKWISLIGHDQDGGVLCYTRGVDADQFIFTGEKIDIDGVQYELAVAYYDTKDGDSKLRPQEISSPSLTQIFMNASVTNEEAAMLGDEYKIVALSQGTQTVGFTSAEEALNTAFGEVTAENAVEWFADAELTSDGASAESEETDGGEEIDTPVTTVE